MCVFLAKLRDLGSYPQEGTLVRYQRLFFEQMCIFLTKLRHLGRYPQEGTLVEMPATTLRADVRISGETS
jgi:hypothetical protein